MVMSLTQKTSAFPPPCIDSSIIYSKPKTKSNTTLTANVMHTEVGEGRGGILCPLALSVTTEGILRNGLFIHATCIYFICEV